MIPEESFDGDARDTILNICMLRILTTSPNKVEDHSVQL